MSEYFNSFDSNMYHENQNTGMGDENNGLHTEAPKQTRKKKHTGRAGRTAKRIGAITLSAVLFGGVAAGTFQGVNYLSGYTAVQTESASAGSAAEGSAAGTTQPSDSGNGQVLQTASSASSDSMSVADVAEAVMPSIVSITNRSVQEVQNYFSMFGYYGGQPQTQETESMGSGIIIGQNDTELLIATNNHVVEGADSLTVSFIDNQAYEANIKGTDSANDLAVIAVPLSSISADTMSQIRTAALGDSDSLRVGEQVVAIGNALGYGQSVTTGVISALNREVTVTDQNNNTVTNSLIQTDAAINPGNSGGALLNINGEVVGINSVKYTDTDVEGMGYAIPIDTAEPIINDLISKEKVDDSQAAYLGVTGVDVNDELGDQFNMPNGIYLTQVVEGSAADQAGIRPGDILTAFDGREVNSMDALSERMKYYAAGTTVEVSLKVSENGEWIDKTVTVTLGKRN